MRKGESGQAFILVLILLAIGSLLMVPALRLTSTSIKSSRIVSGQTEALYAAGAAQEYVIWKLVHDNFASQFTNDGDTAHLTFDNCGTPVDISIVMRAREGQGGMALATDDAIRPTKTVSASNPVSPDTPDHVANSTYQTFTYIIRLEQLSDNNSVGLDAVYDILPKDFGTGIYVPNSSSIRIDGGAWQSLADPALESSGGQLRLKWPAGYDPDTGTGGFSLPIRNFEVRQVKEIKFQIELNVPSSVKNTVQCNWVVLKPWNTLSGPQAPITVGSPAEPGVCDEDGLLSVTKSANPEIIEPGVMTPIEYVITITNQDGFTHQIQEIRDYLPGGFIYSDNSTSGLTNVPPLQSLETLNGVERWFLLWTVEQFPGGNAVSIASGETLTLTFWAVTSKDVSGSYYNEVVVMPDGPVPQIFGEIGVPTSKFYSNYSWNTGGVLVPFYDSRTDADGVIIDANLGIIIGGLRIESWQVY